MGVIDKIQGKRVYLDTNIFVYIFENYPEYQAVVDDILVSIASDGIDCFTNEITLGELLVNPFKNDQEDIANRYIKILNDKEFVSLTPATQSTHIEAARIRANSGMKYPDALHVASALLSGCDVFLTNDKGIKPVEGIELVQLS